MHQGEEKPIPSGEFHTEEFNTVIAAISQIPEVAFLAEAKNQIDGKILPVSRYSTIEAAESNNVYRGLPTYLQVEMSVEDPQRQ